MLLRASATISKREAKTECLALWLWRVSILLLPWQTRWFWEGANVQGFMWEQGRLSFYVSWLPLLWLVYLAFQRRERKKFAADKIFWICCSILFVISLASSSWRATFQWWLQIGVLGSFVWAWSRFNFSWIEGAKWFVISLVPHALLGIWQYATQSVAGSTWLGMAAQDPTIRGVSVVQLGETRVLRAYGGFPHPNVFGGWLASGLALGLAINERFAHKRLARICWASALAILSFALVVTFCRSAWLAAMLSAFIFLACIAWRYLKNKQRVSRWEWSILAVVVLTAGAAAWLARDAANIRVTGGAQLERRSTYERLESVRAGWELFKRHPLLGTGPGALLKAMERDGVEHASGPLIPPHFVPLVWLDELGLAGTLASLILLSRLLRRTERWRDPSSLAFLPLLLLGLLDHYLWTLWSGQALVFILVSLLLFDRKTSSEIPNAVK